GRREPFGGRSGGRVRRDGPAGGGAAVDGLAALLQAAGVDARYVDQFGDEPGDAVGVGVDGLQHEPLLVVGEAFPFPEQGGGEALDGGERGAQLVRDGGDQLGVAAFGAAAGLGVAQGDDEAAQRAGGSGAAAARRHAALPAAGQQQVASRLAVADGEAAVWVGELPPVPAFEVL